MDLLPITPVIAATLLQVIIALLIIALLLAIGMPVMLNGIATGKGDDLVIDVQQLIGVLPRNDPMTKILRDILEAWDKAKYRENKAKALTETVADLAKLLENLRKKPDRTAEEEETIRLLEELLRLLAGFVAEWEEMTKIREGRRRLGSDAEPADAQAAAERDAAIRAAREAAASARARTDGKLNVLPDELAAWDKAVTDKPLWVGPQREGCELEQPPSNVIFGNGQPVRLKPGCCIEFIFEPYMDNWWTGDDLKVEVDPPTGPRTLDIKPVGSANFRRFAPESDPPDQYDFGSDVRAIRICNTSETEPLDIKYVGRPR